MVKNGNKILATITRKGTPAQGFSYWRLYALYVSCFGICRYSQASRKFKGVLFRVNGLRHDMGMLGLRGADNRGAAARIITGIRDNRIYALPYHVYPKAREKRPIARRDE